MQRSVEETAIVWTSDYRWLNASETMNVHLDYASPSSVPKPYWSLVTKWTVFLPIILGIIGWFVGGQLSPPYSYSTSGLLTVRADDVASSKAAQQAFVSTLTSSQFIATISAKTGTPVAYVTSHLTVQSFPNTLLVSISYTDRSPLQAQAMANTIIQTSLLQAAANPAKISVLSLPRQPPMARRPPTMEVIGAACGLLAGVILSIGMMWRKRNRQY